MVGRTGSILGEKFTVNLICELTHKLWCKRITILCQAGNGFILEALAIHFNFIKFVGQGHGNKSLIMKLFSPIFLPRANRTDQHETKGLSTDQKQTSRNLLLTGPMHQTFPQPGPCGFQNKGEGADRGGGFLPKGFGEVSTTCRRGPGGWRCRRLPTYLAHALRGHLAPGRRSERRPSAPRPGAAPCRAGGWSYSGPGSSPGRPSSPAGAGAQTCWGSYGWTAIKDSGDVNARWLGVIGPNGEHSSLAPGYRS